MSFIENGRESQLYDPIPAYRTGKVVKLTAIKKEN